VACAFSFFGIAAISVVAAVSYGLLAAPQPYPDVDHLFVVRGRSDIPGGGATLSLAEMREIADRLGTQYQVSWAAPDTLHLPGPAAISAATVAGSFFDTANVAPLFGTFHASPDEPSVVLSARFWNAHFPGPFTGTQVLVTREGTYRVEGVVPPGFDWPRGADAWLVEREREEATVVAYTRTGLVRTPLSSSGTPSRLPLASGSDRTAQFEPLDHVLYGQSTRAVRLLQIVAALIGLVLVVTLAAFIVIENSYRSHDALIKTALGAPIHTAALEAVLRLAIVLGPGALGAAIAISTYAPQVFRALPVDQSTVTQAAHRVSSVVCGVIVTAALIGLAGTILAAYLRRRAPTDSLRGAVATRLARLIVPQVVVATAALIVAFSFGREVLSLRLTLDIPAPQDMQFLELSGGNRNMMTRGLLAAVERLRVAPGILAAGATSVIPYSNRSIRAHVQPRAMSGPAVITQFRRVDVDYFRTVQLQLKRGRLFNSNDREGAPPVAVINSRLATLFAANAIAPIGTDVEIVGYGRATVVGIVNDRMDLQDGALVVRPELYCDLRQFPTITGGLVVHVDPATSRPANLSALVRAAAPSLEITRTGNLTDLGDRASTPQHFYSAATKAVGIIAVVSALAGTWSTVVLVVLLRRREHAIRVALGATPHRLAVSVLVKSVRSALLGAALGGLLGTVTVRIMSTYADVVVPPWKDMCAVAALFVAALALIAYCTATVGVRHIDVHTLQ
jgi:hypothetical protein